MYPTEKGWRWRRYKCKLCPAIVTFNTWNRHAASKHPKEYRESENPFKELFEEVKI